MKRIYDTIALCLMTLALFCVIFALTLANPDEIPALGLIMIVSIGMSLWFLHDGGES